MGLFSKKKEDNVTEHLQNLEIKQATTTNPQVVPNLMNNQILTTNNSPSKFVNPFSDEQNMSNPFTQNNQIPKTENYYQKQDLNLDFNPNQNMNFNNGNQQQNFNQNQNLQNINNNQNSNSNFNNQNTNFNPTPIMNNMQSYGFTETPVNNLNTTSNPAQTGLIAKEEIQEMIDETIEKLLEEKWETLVENVSKIAMWKEKQENDVKSLREDLIVIKENFEKIEKKFTNRLSDYDKNILDVNSEIKALEKVFQKITPTLVNNVNELSKIADNLRGLKQNSNDSQNNPKSLLE